MSRGSRIVSLSLAPGLRRLCSAPQPQWPVRAMAVRGFAHSSAAAATKKAEPPVVNSLLPRSVPVKQVNSLDKPFNDRKRFLFQMYEHQLQSPVYLIYQNHNLTVGEVKQIRQQLKEKCHPLAQVGIVRSSLMKAVLRGTEFENLNPLFTGPVAIVYVDYQRLQDPYADLVHSEIPEVQPVELLKSMVETTARQSKLLLLGGKLDQQLLNPQLVSHISQLPPLASLHAQLVAGVFGPIQAVHQTIKQIPQSLVFTLDQHRKNLTPKDDEASE
ncbi:hypothetical protein H4R33_003373 [Dimargaris cristalligena]|nr:hypothetical protein H4R33_003373 [Dimargaris cristalligena]